MMKLFLIYKKTYTYIFIISLLFTSHAYCQEVITETQALSFGTITFGSFNSVLRVNIKNNGSFTINGNAIIISNPTRGEYDLSNGIPNASYNITTPASINLTGPGGNFTIDNIRVKPNSLIFDSSGFDQIRVAVRLRSLGGGVQYGNGTYNQTLDLTINY